MNTKNKYDVGTLHKSFNGTMVEVLEVIKGSKRRVRFLEDNSETICTTNSLRDGNLVNRNTFIEKYGIGTIHKTNNGTYCKDDRLKRSIKNDIELLEQKQMKLLQNKSLYLDLKSDEILKGVV